MNDPQVSLSKPGVAYRAWVPESVMLGSCIGTGVESVMTIVIGEIEIGSMTEP